MSAETTPELPAAPPFTADDLEPLNDLLLCRPCRPEEVTEGGIVIPDAAKQERYVAQVLSAGPEAPEVIRPGDFVVYSSFGGTTIQTTSEALLVLSPEDVLCLIRHRAEED